MSWSIDTHRSRVGFSVKHLVVSTVRGEFKSYRGTLRLDPVDFARSAVEGEVDVASIDTGNLERDSQLRTNDFLDAPRHPVIHFQSAAIHPIRGNLYRLTGALTIRGVTRPVALEVAYDGADAKRGVATLRATGTVNRKDFGIAFSALLDAGGMAVGEQVKLELEIRAVASAA